MVQGYYTLLEASQFLGMPPDELKQMAQKNQIRSFQDRGTLRFRIPDVQELARRRGAMSDPELVLGEAPPVAPRSGVSPRPGAASPRTPSKLEVPPDAPDVFDFDLGGESVDVGGELFAKLDQPGSKKPGSGARKTPATPAKTGSDSDVKLVAGGDEFTVSLGSDSDVKLVAGDSEIKLAPGGQPPSSRSSKLGKSSSKLGPASPKPDSGSKSPSKLGAPPADSGTKRPSKLGSSAPSKLGPITPAPPKSPSRLGADSSPKKKPSQLAGQQPDSGVRLVPMDSDSDVRIVGAGSDEVPLGEAPPPDISDSDIRLERVAPHAGDRDAMMLTEEINLDEEIRRQEAAMKKAPRASKLKPKSALQFPTNSPFELSDAELDRPSSVPGDPTALAKPDSSDFELTAQEPGVKDDSSDFDVQPMAESSDFSIELPADEHVLTGKEPGLSGPSSGISLQNPVDAGISLEENESVDFDLSLEAEATPKPAQSAEGGIDSDSEFELSLEDSGQGPLAGAEDSEFELTLDDSGQLAAAEAEATPSATDEIEGQRDIFETDFEVPGLDDSKEAKLDTDLDSSDFDIALDDSDLAQEDESGSQVVALEEEAVDEAAETVQGAEIEIEVEEDDGGFAGLDDGEEPAVEVEEDEETGPVREKIVEKMIEPAPWGAMPVVFMLPCVIVMVLVGLMGFELIQSSSGYKQAGFLTRTFGELLGQKVK